MKALIFSILFIFSLTSNSYAASCSYPNDADLQAQKQECDASSSHTWDCDRNRCVATADTMAVRENYEECKNIENDTERKQCHDNLAKLEVGNLANDKGSDGASAALNGTSAALLFLGTKFKAASGGTCMSAYIAMGGGVVSVLGYGYIKTMAEKKLKDIRKRYEEEQASSNPMEAQTRAFQFLKEEQEAIADLASTRRNTHIMTAVTYTTAAAVALWEQFRPDAQICGANQFMKNPLSIAIYSGIGAGYAAMLAAKAADQKKEAKENVKKVEEILAQFGQSVANTCPAGRDDLSNPECYCFLADGSLNPDRTNSQTCIALNNKLNQSLGDIEAGLYTKASDLPKPGCMTVTKQFDKDCTCKKMRNSKGENACFKVPIDVKSLGSVGNQLSVPSLTQKINDLASGNTNPATINAGELSNLALRNKKGLDQLARKLDKDFKKNGNNQTFDGLVKRGSASLIKNLKPSAYKALASSGLSGSLGNTSALGSGVLADKIKDAKKQILDPNSAKKKLSFAGKGKGALGRGGKKNSNDFSFDFENDSAKNADNVEEFAMNEPTYDYPEGSDIVKNDVSIWKVISHRYLNTGYRRLFDNSKN